jgi:hypothetical protein
MRTEPILAVNGLTRRFGDVVAVDHLDLRCTLARCSPSWDTTARGRRPPFACSTECLPRMAARLASWAFIR